MTRRHKLGRVAAMAAVPALIVGTLGIPAAAQDEMSGEPVAVCELAYLTGDFSELGPSLSNDIIVPVENVINLDPPLGRTWDLFHEDLVGGSEEAQAYRRCVDQHGAEVVISIAHGYRTYRDAFLENVAEADGPVSPSVHGGSIPGNLGGTAAEPIFRAQGLDQSLGHGAVLMAEQFGAENAIIFATNIEGFQLAADGAELGLPSRDIDLIARLDVPPGQPSYRAEAQRIADADPGAVIIQGDSVDVAILINQSLEAGYTGNWIGETGMIQPEFIDTLNPDALTANESIGFAAFGPDRSSPAWEFYADMWTNSTDN